MSLPLLIQDNRYIDMLKKVTKKYRYVEALA